MQGGWLAHQANLPTAQGDLTEVCALLGVPCCQVCLTFHPEGAEWDEPEPVVVSEGFLGSTAGNWGQFSTGWGVCLGNSQQALGSWGS